MFDRVRTWLLSLLRVPPEPEPPWGAPGSVRVFRAGRNYYRLRLLRWAIGQCVTVAGIIFSLWLLTDLKSGVDYYKNAAPATTVQAAPNADAAPQASPPGREVRRPHLGPGGLPRELDQQARKLARRTPWWLFPAIGLFEFGSVLLYLLQLPITYGVLRLDFEQRWYIVTDRSLRIRSGLMSVQESTMSFANVQQVTLTQGPLQRLLGLADVRVRSAGGGSGEAHEKGEDDSMHVGVFHGVDNALAIRDLILERLRSFRAAGLGDPDDHREITTTVSPVAAPPTSSGEDVLAAAALLLVEARALRQACGSQRLS